jgi:hypothetical protein
MIKYLKSISLSCLMLSLLASTPTEAAWSQPGLISSTSSDLALGMDAKGNAMAIWNNTIGTAANDFYYNYILKGQGWYGSLPLSSTEGRAIMSSPSIAMDANSNVVAVWEELEYKDGKNITTVKAGTHPSPGRWSVIDLSVMKGAGRFPQVAMNASGYAVAVWRKWEQEIDSPRIVQAATLQFGGEWSPTVDISTGEEVKVAVDDAGNAIAVWNDNGSIKSASLPFGGSWSSPTTLSTKGAEGDPGLTLAMNASGYTVAVWIEYDTNSTVIKTSTLQFGDSWSKAFEVPLSAPRLLLKGLDVALGRAGNATLVWVHETNDDSPFPMPKDKSIESSFLPFKGKWTKPVRVSPEGVFCYNPQVALDGTGTAYAVWNNDKAIQTSTRPVGGKWTAPADLSTDGNNNNPLIVVDSTGYAVVAWLNSFGGIQAASWAP